MKKTILLTVVFSVAAMMAQATVWRVSNRIINGIPVDADFTTLQAAIDGAFAGDTLYLEGSPTSYGDGIFTKPLHVIGTGYWLEENDSTQAFKQISKVDFLTFDPGSEGSHIAGISIDKSFQSYSNTIKNILTINVDNITIEKSHFYAYSAGYLINCRIIYINGDRNEINIQQNWISTHSYCTVTYGIISSGIYFDGIPSNISVSNNFFRSTKTGHGESIAISMDTLNNNNDIKIFNNVIWGDIKTYYADHINNVWLNGNYFGSGDLMMNNLCNSTQYPPTFNNQQNVNMSTVFVDHDLYIDNGYLLAPGSPAIGAGINGGDCGVFSYDTGGMPYVLSGLPAIPAVYEADIETLGQTGVSVTVKAKSHSDDQ